MAKAWKCMNCQKIFVNDNGKCPKCKLKISYTNKEVKENDRKN